MANKWSASRSNENEEDYYDPVAHRPSGPRTSDFTALMHLLKGSMGNGLLFLPNGFKRTGFIVSIIFGLLMGLLCTHTVTLLVQCAQALCRRHRIPMLDFAKTAEVSFQNGPERIRKYSKIFGVITNIFVCFVHFQSSVIYILYVSTSFQQVIEFVYGVQMNVRIYILIILPLICGLGLVPNLKYLAPFSIFGFFLMATGFSVTLYYLLGNIPDPGRLDTATHALAVPMYCCMFLYSLHNVTLCMPLENTMKTPLHLPWLLRGNMIFNTCVYTIFGFLGYNKYMNATCDTVIKNLPLEEPLAQFVKIAITLSVLCSLGLAFYVPMSILWPLIQAKFTSKYCRQELLRLCGILLTTLVAIAVPEMVPLLGLFASISMTTVMLLIPIAIETATKWEAATQFLLVKNISVSVVWLSLLIFGAIQSVRSIAAEYGGEKEKQC